MAKETDASNWGKIFAANKCTGTFVLFDVDENRITAFNPTRAQKRFTPASTFKIANSVIALETKAVSSIDEILPYGGKAQPFPAWAHDMNMKEAMKISNVAIYQEIARRIGLKRMRHWLHKLNYGNEQTGPVVDQFWLHGPLTISAIEQVKFVAFLAQDKLPVSVQTQAAVRRLIQQDDDKNLFAKTGWANRPKPQIGWWVGFVQKKNKIYSFALNIDMAGEQDIPKRQKIGREILKELGLI